MIEAKIVLSNAGIDVIARQDKQFPGKFISEIKLFNNYFPSPVSSNHEKIPAAATPSILKQENGAAALIANFHSMLKNLQLTEAERNELSARINRKLVLCESQLKDACLRYEKLEARHLDYTGKQAIARQAIAQQSPVEIEWPGGEKKRTFGIPKALEKEGGELILVFIPEGKQESLRIPLGKISLLRRIKKSIFQI